jgi:hypothetical protein
MCVFLKLFGHDLLYKFIDSIELKWCIGHVEAIGFRNSMVAVAKANWEV